MKSGMQDMSVSATSIMKAQMGVKEKKFGMQKQTHLQYYFRIAVRQNTTTTVQEMRDDITFYHNSTDEKLTHLLCPVTKDS
ncbi:hypothetical protein E2C01_063238 [Portunus trituberculatus]|uniref:Uncharacterized protein n=1 Tax=Portunus trituberculatus TaxID=210409 RepID=A0A5B7HHK7_PORTR|nr:hypothetical protein [Portunus trituberculatus]